MASLVQPGFATFRSGRDWLSLLATILCICCGATAGASSGSFATQHGVVSTDDGARRCLCRAAGLTLGMVSLDPLELQLKARAGTPEEREYSEKASRRAKR